MSEYASTATLKQIGQRLAGAKNILITTHFKVDGDAIGSALALARVLSVGGKRCDVWLSGPIERGLLLIAPPTPIHRVEKGLPRDDYDLIVIVDTGAWSQLEGLADWLRPRREKIIVIDHHRQGDDIASMRYVDPSAAATTQIILELTEEMDWPISGGVGGAAEALFAGLATDTGWFRFAGADASAFAAAARLLAMGVDKSRLYQIIEETYRPQRLALEARALSSIEYHLDGAAALMSLRLHDFKETGGSVEDLTNLINEPMTVEQVRVSILLSQSEPGKTKIGLRSKPRAAGDQSSLLVDVNALARLFGGGGHTHAAGARVTVDLDAARLAVLDALGKIAGPALPSRRS